jgi:hypothetical protein
MSKSMMTRRKKDKPEARVFLAFDMCTQICRFGRDSGRALLRADRSSFWAGVQGALASNRWVLFQIAKL